MTPTAIPRRFHRPLEREQVERGPDCTIGTGHDQFNSVTCSTASDCWAVGFAGPNTLSDNFLPNIMPQVSGDQAFVEHWNGHQWSVTPAPAAAAPEGTYLNSVTCTSSTRCWAVGRPWAPTAIRPRPGRPVGRVKLVDRAQCRSLGHRPGVTDVTCLGASECWPPVPWPKPAGIH